MWMWIIGILCLFFWCFGCTYCLEYFMLKAFYSVHSDGHLCVPLTFISADPIWQLGFEFDQSGVPLSSDFLQCSLVRFRIRHSETSIRIALNLLNGQCAYVKGVRILRTAPLVFLALTPFVEAGVVVCRFEVGSVSEHAGDGIPDSTGPLTAHCISFSGAP